jgi:hypothetical protein
VMAASCCRRSPRFPPPLQVNQWVKASEQFLPIFSSVFRSFMRPFGRYQSRRPPCGHYPGRCSLSLPCSFKSRGRAPVHVLSPRLHLSSLAMRRLRSTSVVGSLPALGASRRRCSPPGAPTVLPRRVCHRPEDPMPRSPSSPLEQAAPEPPLLLPLRPIKGSVRAPSRSRSSPSSGQRSATTASRSGHRRPSEFPFYIIFIIRSRRCFQSTSTPGRSPSG